MLRGSVTVIQIFKTPSRNPWTRSKSIYSADILTGESPESRCSTYLVTGTSSVTDLYAEVRFSFPGLKQVNIIVSICLAHKLLYKICFLITFLEELVEHVLSSPAVKGREGDPINILDIGTGTGAIGISLLSALPNAICTAVDINPEAILLARENAQAILGKTAAEKRFKTVTCNFVSFAQYSDHQNQYDVIVSNPPYIPSNDLRSLAPEVVEFESNLALDGGVDGLDIIKDIIRFAPQLFRKHQQGVPR